MAIAKHEGFALSENDLREAILLIKTGNKAEAQKILKSLLEVDLSNIHAWVWYVETLDTLNQKIRALELCSKYNPDNERVQKGLEALKAYRDQAPLAEGQITEGVVETRQICPFCGTSNRELAKECVYCGSSLTPAPRLPQFDFSFKLPTLQSVRNFLYSFASYFRGFQNIRSWPLLIFFLPAVGLCLIGMWLVRRPASISNNNALAIGDLAKVESISVMVRAPVELDNLTKADVLALRIEEVYRYPELLYSGYEPYDRIFGDIVDGLPWWGISGHFYYGVGEQSIEGPSEESRFILNPYLLVAAEPCGRWDKNKVSEDLILRPGFLFYCPPQQLKWEPERSYAEVTYDASCVSQRNYSCFNLIAYNARDLNLSYIYVSYEDSINISKSTRPDKPYAIPQYIHHGNSCGYPGGCNNMSPATPDIDGLSVVGYPARADIWLWEEMPETLEVPPDMIFVIRIR